MNNKSNIVFWAVMSVLIIAFLIYILLGCASKADGEQSSLSSIPPTISVDSSDELEQQHRSHEVEKVEAGKLDDAGEPIDEEPEETDEESEEYYDDGGYYEYYSSYEYSYTGGATATTTHDLLNGQGRAYDENGTSYTYYNHDIGYGALDIPGETFDSDGVSHDADGYIVVAADGYEYGEVIDTPYGEARCYDHGSGYGNIDIYTNR